MKILSWRMMPFLGFVALLIFFWRGLSLDPRHLPSTQIDKPLPDFRLPLLNNDKDWLSKKNLKGHISLLTFWASWCEACGVEQPFLLELKRSGVFIYGINYKDNPTNAKKWLMEWGNPFQLIGEDIDGRLAIDLGVYGSPETFLIDKKGLIRYRHVGVLDEKSWQQIFLPLMQGLT